MNEEQLSEIGISVESYGGGYILADYSGNRGEASYRGSSDNWIKQPMVRDPFPDKESAISAGVESENKNP